MKFTELVSGSSVFIDANIFIYAFAPEPQFGLCCSQLLERIERHDLQGFTSTHVLSDVAHRLMTIEACAKFGWPYPGIASRLVRHPTEVQSLTQFRVAIEAIIAIGVQLITVRPQHVVAATILSQQFGLLSNDALIVALMREHGLTQIASHDDDFDGVTGLQRFESA